MRGWTKVLLFLSSYAPMFMILYVRGLSPSAATLYGAQGIGVCSGTPLWFSILMIALTVLPFAFLYAVLRITSKAAGTEVSNVTATSRSEETLSYVVTYIIPFLTFEPSSPQDIVSIAILLLTLGSIYVNSSMLYINPTLSLLGYGVYRVDGLGSTTPAMLISKRGSELRNARIYVACITDNIFLEVK